jgi:hypothetical protein
MAGRGLALKIPRARRRDGADGRAVLASPPLPAHGRVAYRGRGAHDTGQGREASCVEEEEGLPLGVGPLLRAGQVSCRQRVMAASSRWRARRAGCCGLQRLAWPKRPTWRGWEEPPMPDQSRRRSSRGSRAGPGTHSRRGRGAAMPASGRAARQIAGGGPRWGAMAQGCRPSLAGTPHPRADGRFAAPHRLGDLVLAPALLRELPGVQPSGFFPVVA